MLQRSMLLALFFIGFSAMALKQESPSAAPEGVTVYIISPVDGQTVPQTFTVQFGLIGMGVAPAGIEMANTGHHHLLIDGDVLPNMEKPMQPTDKLRHFGGGHTETQLTLAPGVHTLQLILGNYAHVPYNPPLLSKKITVIVK